MFTKLSPSDLARYRVTGSHPEYAEFLKTLAMGDGGLVNIAKTGVGRQTVKNRLNAAAAAAGTTLKFIRSNKGTLLFEVAAASEAPKRRRGRKPKGSN